MKFLKEMTPAQACLIGILIAALLFFFSFGGLTNDKQIIQLKRQKQDLMTKNTEADKLIDEAKKYKNRLDNLGNTINKVIKYIPKDMSSVKLTKSLTSSASEAGVNIVGVSDSKSRNQTSSELYSEVPVRITLDGSFTQMMVFLSKLTELENIVTMSEFKIRSESKLGDGVVSFVATFVGYKYKALNEEANKK